MAVAKKEAAGLMPTNNVSSARTKRSSEKSVKNPIKLPINAEPAATRVFLIRSEEFRAK